MTRTKWKISQKNSQRVRGKKTKKHMERGSEWTSGYLHRKKQTNRAVHVVINKGGRCCSETCLSGGKNWRKFLLVNPLKAVFLFHCGCRKAGNTKRRVVKSIKKKFWDSLKQKRDHYKDSSCCCDWSAIVHGLSVFPGTVL